MNAKKKGYYYIMMIASIVIFSTFEVVTKTMDGALSGLLLTFYRFIIGGAILMPFAIRDIRRRKFKFTLKYVLILFVLGFMLVFVSMTLAQYGVFFSTASISAVLFSTNPLFISLFSSLILKEKLTSPKVIGLLIGILGLVVACIHMDIPIAISKSFMIGVFLTLFSMLVFSVYTVLNVKISISLIGPTAATAFSSVFGALTIIPLLIYQGVHRGINPFYFDIKGVLPQFLYIAIVLTGFAYLLYFTALTYLETSTGSLAFLVKPPLASLFASVFLGEVLTINNIVGIIFIIVGLFIAITVSPSYLSNLYRVFKYRKMEKENT